MYTVSDREGNVVFTFARPSSEVNDIIDEFVMDLERELSKLNDLKKLKTLKEVFNLILLCEEGLTKNCYAIERLKFELNLSITTFYFHFSKKTKSNTNELIEAIPQLFDESDPGYFYIFLKAIKHTIVSELRSLEQRQLDIPSEMEPSIIKYTQNQIAMAVRYQQIAGSREDFKDGEKVKEIKKVADQYGVSAEAFKKAYNEATKAGNLKYRLNVLRDIKNQNAILEILRSDLKALNQLKIDIDKLKDPLP